MRFSTFLINAFAATMASAHGSHDIKREQAIRRTLLQNTKKDLSHCAAKIRSNGLEARSVQRRAARLESLTERKGLKNKAGRSHPQSVQRHH